MVTFLAKAVERSICSLPEFPSQNILSGSQEEELLHSATKFSGRGIIELQLLMVNHGFVPLHPVFIVHVEIKQQIHRAILKRGDAHILQWCNSILRFTALGLVGNRITAFVDDVFPNFTTRGVLLIEVVDEILQIRIRDDCWSSAERGGGGKR